MEQTIAAGKAVAGVLAQDSGAFEAFYHATAPALAAYIRRVSGHPSAAEDILQEAFYRFLRAPHAGMDGAQMRSYLYRTATTIIYDQFRRAQVAERAGASRPLPDTVVADPSARVDMERALAGLSPRDRALVWLAYVEGASHAEIAAALGLARLSVRVLLFHARKKLAKILRVAEEGRR